MHTNNVYQQQVVSFIDLSLLHVAGPFSFCYWIEGINHQKSLCTGSLA